MRCSIANGCLGECFCVSGGGAEEARDRRNGGAAEVEGVAVHSSIGSGIGSGSWQMSVSNRRLRCSCWWWCPVVRGCCGNAASCQFTSHASLIRGSDPLSPDAICASAVAQACVPRMCRQRHVCLHVNTLHQYPQ